MPYKIWGVSHRDGDQIDSPEAIIEIPHPLR